MVISKPKKFTVAVCQNLTPLKFSIQFLRELAGWRSGWSVRFAIGRPGAHSLSLVIPKDFKKWYAHFPCLALSTKKG